MSKKQYLRALNLEIQKLNGIIDDKIFHEKGYRKEALRHKKLLREIRREEMRRSFLGLTGLMRLSWF